MEILNKPLFKTKLEKDLLKLKSKRQKLRFSIEKMDEIEKKSGWRFMRELRFMHILYN